MLWEPQCTDEFRARTDWQRRHRVCLPAPRLPISKASRLSTPEEGPDQWLHRAPVHIVVADKLVEGIVEGEHVPLDVLGQVDLDLGLVDLQGGWPHDIHDVLVRAVYLLLVERALPDDHADLWRVRVFQGLQGLGIVLGLAAWGAEEICLVFLHRRPSGRRLVVAGRLAGAQQVTIMGIQVKQARVPVKEVVAVVEQVWRRAIAGFLLRPHGVRMEGGRLV
mmetsp:Transcript_16654/g.39538  ORF Transcript_16654/g.39538 Transcript_16654/m.39538 type:complete len:221 (-) Transcript_16654:239-901(-)